MNKTQAFLKEFKDRLGIFGTPEGRQKKYDESKKNILGLPLPEFGVSEFLKMPDMSKAKQKIEEKEEADQLAKDAFNRQQMNKDIRNLLLLNTGLREFESKREAQRNMNFARQYLQMASAAQESAARRRLMEDQFSPTKISQQRLRAQQGEAALMNAISNHTTAAVNMARSGINPRGRAGGA